MKNEREGTDLRAQSIPDGESCIQSHEEVAVVKDIAISNNELDSR